MSTLYKILYLYLFHGNKLDLYACLTKLKFAIEIEYNKCKSTNNALINTAS